MGIITTLAEAREHLADGSGATPGCVWGSHSSDMEHVAWALACLWADSSGENVDGDMLDNAMGLVVNSHPDVESLIGEHGPSVGWVLVGEYDVERVPWLHYPAGDGGGCTHCGSFAKVNDDYLCIDCHQSEDI